MLMVSKAISDNAFYAIALNSKLDMLLGDDKTESGMGGLIGTGEKQQFRCRNFQTGGIKDLFEIFGIQQP